MSDSKNVQAYGLAAKDTTGIFSCLPIERRQPCEEDVLIKVTHCGICHSDLHQVRAEWPMPHFYPMIPGHEVVGEVISVGSGVTKYKKGDRVGVGCMVDSCRKCGNCKISEEQYCTGGGMVGTYNYCIKDAKKIRIKNHSCGENLYGGYSTHITVAESFVLGLPKNIPQEKAGPLLCAGITLFSPLKHYGAGNGGLKVGIIGFGGLGHMGVKIGAAMGNEMTVISRGTKKQALAKACGATSFINSKDEKEFKAAAGSLDLLIDTIAANHPVREYLSLLKTNGTLCLVGVPPNNFEVGAFDIIGGRKKIGGSLIGGIKETQEMLEFCSKHNITPDTEIIKADQVNKAYHRLYKGENAHSRFVIDMSTLTKETKVIEEPAINPKDWNVHPVASGLIFPPEANKHK